MKPALRWIVLLVLAAVSLSSIAGARATGRQQPSPLVFGVVQGTVTRAGSSDPLPDAKVTVELGADQSRVLRDAMLRGGAGVPPEVVQALQAAQAPRPAGAAAPAPPFSAVTDSAGRFSINAPEGAVVVRAQLDGYYGPMSGGTSPAFVTEPAVISARQPVVVRLEMIPGGTISGRVTDMGGKILVEAIVAAAQRNFRNGLPALDVVDGRPTDDRGTYRIYRLPPGEYVLVVVQKRDTTPAGSRASGPIEVPVSTYYPGVVDLTTAQVVTVAGGDDLAGLDIPVRTALTYAISGHVTSLLPSGSEPGALNNPGRPPIPVMTVLPHEGTGLPDINGGIVNANPDGTFEVRGLLPGSYDVIARMPAAVGWGPQNAPDRAQSPWAFGRVAVDVVATNVENVAITVHQGMDVKGRVTVDGKPMPAAVRVTLQPDDNAAIYTSFYQVISNWAPFLEADGSFKFPLIPEARYRVNVGLTTGPTRAPTPNAQGQMPPAPVPIAATAYLADVTQGGRSVLESGFVVMNEAVPPLEVAIRTDSGSVDGAVTGADGKPAARTTVVLVPDAPHRSNSALYRTAMSDTQGRFSMTRVAPGSYKAFAWYNVVAGVYESAQFLGPFEARGVPVKVAANGRAQIDLSAIR